LQALGEYLYFSLHLALQLLKFMLFGLKLLFGFLTVFDQVQVLLFKLSKYLHELFLILKPNLVFVV
jgi:hypothetical protein